MEACLPPHPNHESFVCAHFSAIFFGVERAMEDGWYPSGVTPLRESLLRSVLRSSWLTPTVFIGMASSPLASRWSPWRGSHAKRWYRTFQKTTVLGCEHVEHPCLKLCFTLDFTRASSSSPSGESSLQPKALNVTPRAVPVTRLESKPSRPRRKCYTSL